METKANTIILFILAFVIYSCQQSKTLTPDEWLPQYNAAWTECNRKVPLNIPAATNYFNPDQDISNAVAAQTEHNIKVEELMKEEYPELYSYAHLPEYRAKLVEQGICYYNSVINHNQQEIDKLDEELDAQIRKNRYELEEQRRRNERYLKDHPAPKYR
jgi:hypothetical protein